MSGREEGNEKRACGASQSEDWHPARIKYELEVRGYSLAKLSRLNGYSPTAAGRALRTSWPAMEAAIAEAIGVAPERIWPSRYDERGVPHAYKPRRRRVPQGSTEGEQQAPADPASNSDPNGDQTR